MDRTAYPRQGERLTPEELDARYSLSETDLAFIRAEARAKSSIVNGPPQWPKTLP